MTFFPRGLYFFVMSYRLNIYALIPYRSPFIAEVHFSLKNS